MLDVQLYGMDPGRHHHINVLFHAFNTLLLFLIFYRMTGALWRSAMVAALFALHPINVESVAWVAQRKNLLSTFLGLLTLLIYTGYAKRPNLQRYLGLVITFALGLLAKPMLVTLPCVLMLMDYWPLKRFGFKQPIRECLPLVFRLFLEKIPLLILSALSVYLSTASVKGIGIEVTLQTRPLMLRIGNALVSYLSYIGKLIWPANLTIYYPYPDKIPLWQVLGALAVLAVISVGVIRVFRKYPYLGVGWLWYLGTLTPVIGLVQAGLWPQMADRWAYVPFIGLFIMIAWGAAELLSHWRYKRFWVVIVAAAVLTALVVTSHIQAGYWANSFNLFSRALKVTKNNAPAHNNLAIVLTEHGRYDEAIYHANAAIDLSPNNPFAHNNLGYVFLKSHQYYDAIRNFKIAIKLNPAYTKAYFNLATALMMIGNIDAAISSYRMALDLAPDNKYILNDFANAMVAQGRFTEALSYYTKVLDLDPNDPDTYNNMGVALIHLGRLNEAVRQFRLALNLKPDFADASENLDKALRKPP